MKRLFLTITITFFTVVAFAQPQMGGKGFGKFDANRFKQEMRKFICGQAQLTEQEADKFFPLFEEMKAKERALFEKQRKFQHKPQTEEDYKVAIETYDKIDLELKTLQKSYHQKFLKVLPAKKVFLVIRADDGFRTQMFRNMAKFSHQPHPQQKNR